MNTPKLVIALVAIASGGAFAQSAGGGFVERDINQQQRIEQGLQSGQLTTREAARLERQESKVERMESKSLSDGKVTSREAQRIDQAQNRVSNDIYRENHDAQTGNPNSPSSQRMQGDVQRNINQQQRIQQGMQNGSLTPREAGRLEGGQARVNRMEARTGADGHVGRFEQQRIQHAENRQSGNIYQQRHDGQSGRGMRGDGGGHGRADGRGAMRAEHLQAGGYGPQGDNGNHFGQNRNGNNGNHFGANHQGGRHTLARR